MRSFLEKVKSLCHDNPLMPVLYTLTFLCTGLLIYIEISQLQSPNELVEVKVVDVVNGKYRLEVTETGQRTWTEHYRGDENEIFTIESKLLNDYDPNQPLVEVEIVKFFYNDDKTLLEVTETKQRIVIDQYQGKSGEVFKLSKNALDGYLPPKEKDFIQIQFE